MSICICMCGRRTTVTATAIINDGRRRLAEINKSPCVRQSDHPPPMVLLHQHRVSSDISMSSCGSVTHVLPFRVRWLRQSSGSPSVDRHLIAPAASTM